MKSTSAAALALLLAGCNLFAPDPSGRVLRGTGPDQSITLGELEDRTRNYADRYVQLLAEATEEIKQRTVSPDIRRRAHQILIYSATSAWDIVTSSHPLQELLDLFVQTELQLLLWHEEGLARRTFGQEPGARLSSALVSAQHEILLLVRRALTEDQIRELQKLIRDWRQRNPAVATGAFIRFGPYLESPGGTLVTQIMTGFGILNLSNLNPLDPAAQSVENVRETAADAFYMAKRLPMLLHWQTEAATYDILQAVDAAGTGAQGTLREGQALLRDATQAFQALERITNPPGRADKAPAAAGPPARPFDIRDYEAAGRQAAQTAGEARALLAEARQLVDSPGLDDGLREVRRSIERILAQLLAGGLLLLLVFFVLLAVYRVVSLQLLKDRDTRR
jgi:hypothetical protein